MTRHGIEHRSPGPLVNSLPTTQWIHTMIIIHNGIHIITYNNNNNNNNNREKKDKYLDLARELKKLWNMQVTIISIVIGSFGTVTKGLLKGLEDLKVGG